MNSGHMDLLSNALLKLNISVTPQIIEKFSVYRAMVMEWNKKINLTSITDDKEFVLKHFIDSVMCASFSGMNDINKIIDVGTGAGFPGIPLSIILENKEFILLDALNKRVQFLSEVIHKLELNHVKVFHGRAEDLGNDKDHREKYDLCLSRAVAKLNVLSEYCLPFVKINGYFAAYKSRSIESEIKDSLKAVELLGGAVVKEKDIPLSDEFQLEHQIIYIQKVKHTPQKYPRKAGKPLKNPLK